MKKLFEKHTIAKLLGIMILIAIVLTWVLPYGIFQGTEFVKYGNNRIGLNDISTVAYNSFYIVLDKIIYLLVLGGFYAVLSKTKGYNKLVSNIVNKIKGKEHLFVVFISIVITILTSITTNSFAMLLFVPLLITIMLNSGINKVTAFASTFGAILVGILGATLGTEALNGFNLYFSQTLTGDNASKLTITYRIIILAIGVILYNFFLYFAAKKSLSSKQKEEIDDSFKVEETNKKDVKTFPIIVILFLLAALGILGFVDWQGSFNIKAFTNFHTWLTGLKIGKDYTLVAYLLGTNAVAFGSWDLYTISTVLVILSILTAILYKIKFDDLLSTFGSGALKLIKPIGALAAVYSVFVIVYMSPVMPTVLKSVMKKDGVVDINIDYNGAGIAFFNIDTDDDNKADYNLINKDTDKDGKCDLNCDTNKDGYPDKNLDFNANGKLDDYDKAVLDQLKDGKSVNNLDTDQDGIPDVNIDTSHNLFKIMLGAFITDTFHVDLGYTGYVLSDYFVTSYGAVALELVFLVFFAIYGLLQFFIPTSMLLVLGLTYTKVDYKDWMKHIWRFILGMFVVLLIIFIFISLK